MAQRLMFIHALTPLHAGTGQGVGAIDLPIHRERATHLPLLPGSSIKGCLRDAMSEDANCDLLFGSRSKNNEEMSAGALHISDAHLLLLPVRCIGATFVWATCPFVLKRLSRLAIAAAEDAKALPTVPNTEDGKARLASMDATVKLKAASRLVLEDLDLDPGPSADPEAVKWCEWLSQRLFPADKDPWRDEFKKRFAIIDDKSFDFLSEFATEVSAHIAIDDEKGTVKDGMLWYQEALPAESVLSGILHADKPRRSGNGMTADSVLDLVLTPKDIQFGGKASTGMGFARFIAAKI
jgi:CRISPR-associated protein Cmr4